MKKFFRKTVSLILIFTVLCTVCACAKNIEDDHENSSATSSTDSQQEIYKNYIVTADLVNIRKEPNINSEIVDKYFKNTIVAATLKNEKWNKIKLDNDSEAYIFADYTKEITDEEYEKFKDYQIAEKKEKYAIISATSANIRSLPSTDSDIIATIQKDDSIKILATTENNWYVIEYNEITCYISPEVVQLLSSKEEYESYISKPTKGIYTYSEDTCSLIGSYTTDYSFSSENRAFNLEKASDEMNNLVILPGSTFNWCRDMGPCGKDEGYLESNEIVNDEYVTGYGGGICQLSSTLSAAICESDSNISFIQRSTHSLPQAYISSDLEATVSYPDCNFIFKNDNDYKILIRVSYDGYYLTVNLFKINE